MHVQSVIPAAAVCCFALLQSVIALTQQTGSTAALRLHNTTAVDAVPAFPSLDRLANAQLLNLIAPRVNTSSTARNPATRAASRSSTQSPGTRDPCAAPKRSKKACIKEPAAPVFKDRQTSVPSARWDRMSWGLRSGQALDPYLVDELEPYLYDMDYVSPTTSELMGGPGPRSHLWDPELRETGAMHCEDPRDCLAVYLPELYYAGDEYMGGWAVEGFNGEGLRSAIGPNIAAGDDPRNYNYTYIPYTQRIIFAPAASLFFPYLFSIYAGVVYVAETDPLLATLAFAARAGVVEDYYYVNNYYNWYSFITWGVASSAVVSAQARVRGIVGTGAKIRNFNAILATITRDDYNERNRILLLNGIAFLGTSGGGYIFSNPQARNAFVGQTPLTTVPYYAYDYSGATNPFPLAPATG